jgi:hypothetical protein
MIAADLLSGNTSETRVEEYRPTVDPSGRGRYRQKSTTRERVWLRQTR